MEFMKLKSIFLSLLFLVAFNSFTESNASNYMIYHQWDCSFSIESNENNPQGNFYDCDNEGCESEINHNHNDPGTYREIHNFRVDFKAKRISFEEYTKTTLTNKKENTTSRHYDVRFKIIDISNLHEYEKGQDQVITISFNTFYEPSENSSLEKIDPLPENHILSQGFRMNTISFYDGGTKLVWIYTSPSNHKKKSMYATSGFGECTPIK